MDSETNKLIEVAKLYYQENLNQAEIAKKIGVSRPLVSNMLAKARQEGIVEITIKEPFANNTLLLNQLKNVFNIQNGFVIPSANSEYITDKSIITQSSNFIKTILPEVKTIGIGWGRTLGRLISELCESDVEHNLEGDIVPLIGTASFPDKGYHPSELVREFAEKTGMKPHFFISPAFPTSEQERDLYVTTENYSEIESLWKKLDLVVVSIGGFPSVPDNATALRFNDILFKEHAVGKILSYFFDRDGRIINSETDYALQIPKGLIGGIKRVVAICPDEVSAKAVLGALKTGFITDVVMTEDKAKAVISLRG